MMEPVVIIFLILIVVLILVITAENYQIRRYREQYNEMAEAIVKLGTAFNTNTEIQKNDRVIMRESVVDIAMIKSVLEIHAKVIDIPLPKDEWQELVRVVKEANSD